MKAQLKFFILLTFTHSHLLWIAHSIAGKVRFRPAMPWILECRSIINQENAGSVSSLYLDFSTITAFVLVGSYAARPVVQDPSYKHDLCFTSLPVDHVTGPLCKSPALLLAGM